MKKISRVLIGGVLVTVGCGCFLYPDFREWNTQREVEQIIEKFDETYSETLEIEDVEVVEDIGESITNNASSEKIKNKDKNNYQSPESSEQTTQETTNSSNLGLTSASRPLHYQSLYNEMVEYNSDLTFNGQEIVDAWSYEQQPFDLSHGIDKDNPVIGYLTIPDMQIRLPLMLGASPDNLEKGAAVLSETSMPIGGDNTNCVIAGHRGWEGSAYFQYVENMRHGSKVYITNPWETLVYECTDIKVIYPDDVDSILIQPGKDMITLFTCHPYRLGGGPYRYLVFCERVDTQKRTSIADTHKVINPKVTNDDSISSMTIEELEDLKIEDINEAIDKKEAEMKRPSIPLVSDTVPDISPAELSSDGFDLLALEQTLRYFLPATMILFSILIGLYRRFKPKKRTKKNEKGSKNKKEKIRRTKI